MGVRTGPAFSRVAEAEPTFNVDPYTGEPAAINLDLSETNELLSTPAYPETLSVDGVQAVKVSQVGAGAVTIQALDSDELWDVVGWRLSFTLACTLTIVVDDDDPSKQYAFDIPAPGIDEAAVGFVAWFSGNIGEPVTFANSAGNMKGVVYVRKHA